MALARLRTWGAALAADKGAVTALEYALMGALVAGVTAFSGSVADKFATVAAMA